MKVREPGVFHRSQRGLLEGCHPGPREKEVRTIAVFCGSSVKSLMGHQL